MPTDATGKPPAPPPPKSGPGLKSARARIAEEKPERFAVEKDLAALLAAWLRRTHTSQDAFGGCSDQSGAYVAKVLAVDVPMQVVSLVMLPKRDALDVLDELRAYVIDRDRTRRAG